MYNHYHNDNDWHEDCEGCWEQTLDTPDNPYRLPISNERSRRLPDPHAGTNVIFDMEDSDISNPPEEATWYPLNNPNASWNLPK